MPLSPGLQVGPYEVVAPIGAGGMGEVWRARPTAVWRIHPVVVTPEGRYYAYSATQSVSDLYVYTGLR